MNFQEAESFVESKKHLVGKKIFIPAIQGTGVLNQFVIAPFGKLLDVLSILSKSEVDNKEALNLCGLIRDELNVFAIGKANSNELFPMSFEEYLRTNDLGV